MPNDPSGSSGRAFGHPGIPPTWTASSKDGIGTAYATASRVWFTLAQGILTEIYYPTIDRPQLRDEDRCSGREGAAGVEEQHISGRRFRSRVGACFLRLRGLQRWLAGSARQLQDGLGI